MWTKGPRDEDVPIVIERFGDDIESKEDVTERIRRAQRAILNRSTSLKTFLEGDDEDPNTSEITFSKNCVYLEISGSDVPDLSFVDLPGSFLPVELASYVTHLCNRYHCHVDRRCTR